MTAVFESFCRNEMGEAFVKSPMNARGCEIPSGNVCYVCDEAFTYILNPATFAIDIGPVSVSGAGSRRGIGGDGSVVWQHQGSQAQSTSIICELSPIDLSLNRCSPNLNTSGTWGCGGTQNTIWDCDLFPGALYERDPVSFSIIHQKEFAAYNDPDGIGGSNDRVWFCDSGLDVLLELQPPTGIPDDFKELQSVSAPGSTGVPSDQEGIGGGNNRVYHCNTTDGELYALLPDTLAVELGPVTSPTSLPPWGIGGE